MFLLHMAQPSRDLYQDQPVGRWGGAPGPLRRGTLTGVQFSASLWAAVAISPQGGILFKIRI